MFKPPHFRVWEIRLGWEGGCTSVVVRAGAAEEMTSPILLPKESEEMFIHDF